MSRSVFTSAALVLFLAWITGSGPALLRSAVAAGGKDVEQSSPATKEVQQKSTVEELLALEKRRQQLIEKEAALAAKEKELNRISENIDARIKELNTAKKAYEEVLTEKKKSDAETVNAKYMKIFKLLKAMKPEEAAKIMDKLEEPVAIGLLEKYDQKTVLKLSKHISQPRLQKWIRKNLEAGATQ